MNTFPLPTPRKDWQHVQKENPLVLCLTNYVVMNLNANALLAIGAAPLMAHSQRELKELVEKADSLVINIGTLDDDWLEAMHFAVEWANQYDKPIVLDPVGCGFTRYRTQAAQNLAAHAKRLWIRGNADEIRALIGQSSHAKGLDAKSDDNNVPHLCHETHQQFKANIVITGRTDWIYENGILIQNNSGDPYMRKVTGMGCTLSALIGAFTPYTPHAGLAATVAWTLAGEHAAKQSQGIGEFGVRILDALEQITTQSRSVTQNWSRQ